jgi:hypothetical protein
VNQSLIDEIVSGILARLQSAPARPVNPQVSASSDLEKGPIKPVSPLPVSVTAPLTAGSAGRSLVITAGVLSNVSAVPTTATATAATTTKTNTVELLAPIITAELLNQSLKAGEMLRIGRGSILTPSARDWLNSKRTVWSRQDKMGPVSSIPRPKWRMILQTMTPTVQALHESLRRLAEEWTIEIVGQPIEAARLAMSLVNTSECDGVVIFTEQADLVACQANRSERVRAAVMQNSKQWEQVLRSLGANVVCISPIGRSFMELRNLLKECAGNPPQPPPGM